LRDAKKFSANNQSSFQLFGFRLSKFQFERDAQSLLGVPNFEIRNLKLNPGRDARLYLPASIIAEEILAGAHKWLLWTKS
jgi:hypothetical protein